MNTRLLLILTLTLAGCGSQTPPLNSASLGLYVAQQPQDLYVELTLAGSIENTAPDGYKPAVDWVPINWIAYEGSQVAPGDALVRYDVDTLTRWIDEEEAERQRLLAQDAQRKHQAQDQIAELLAKREKLIRDRNLAQATLDAAGTKNANELAILKLEVEAAQERVANAEKQLARLEQLADAGSGSASRLRRAHNELERARSSLRLPQLRLELLEGYTASATRAQLQLDIAMIDEELGTSDRDGKIDRDLTIARDREARSEDVGDRRLQWEFMELERKSELRENPEVTAGGQGTTRYGEGDVRIGGKFNDAPIQVLEQETMAIDVVIPEAWRDLVRSGNDNHEATTASITLPTHDNRVIEGVVTHIDTAPIAKGPAQDGFRLRVEPVNRSIELPQGAKAIVALRVPVPLHAATVPIWQITNLEKPSVKLADGDTVPVTGFRSGDWFVITSGIEPGALLVPPLSKADPDTVRVTGHVEVSREVTVPVIHWNMTIAEVIPNGTTVEKDQVIARLTTDGDELDETRFEVEHGLRNARSLLRIDTLKAESDRTDARIAWRKSVHEAQQARIEYLLDRFAAISEATVSSEIALVDADIAMTEAGIEYAKYQDPAIRATISSQKHEELAHAVTRSEIAWRQARLEHIASLRSRDWIKIGTSQQKQADKLFAADSKRLDFRLAQDRFSIDLGSAQRDYQKRIEELRWERRRLAASEMRAPVAGTIYYRPQYEGQEIKPGTNVNYGPLFSIPIGSQRKITLEIPTQFYDRFANGDIVPLRLPALGGEAIKATVQNIGGAFEFAAPDDPSSTAQIFTLTLSFSDADTDGVTVPPGTTGYLDLSS